MKYGVQFDKEFIRDIMNFIEKITRIITNPKNTMDDIASQPMIEESLMIVGIYAVLGAISALVMTDKIIYEFEGMEDIPSSVQSIMAISSVVAALIGTFFIWILGAGIIHIIALALGGEGKFYPQMVTVIGFSMIPLIFGGIISIISLYQMEPLTIIVSSTNPQVANDMLENPYLFISMIIGTLMQIWAAAIIFFGVQSAHKLTPGKSAIAASIPVIFAIISTIWSTGML